MTRDLYFIPLIVDALRQPDPISALRDCLDLIKEMGTKPEYRQGYGQFLRFMEALRKFYGARVQAPELEADLSEWEGDELKALQDLMASQPQLQKELNRLWHEISPPEPPIRKPEVVVERDGKPVTSIPLEDPPFVKEIGNIKPGRYTLNLDTGRMIWEGRLNPKELIWAMAFPGKDLQLAADTGEEGLQPTKEVTLLGGEIILKVFPGPESGRLRLERRDLKHG